MARGGARPGAGRKLGAATRKTRELADQAAQEGRMPLEVILRAMNEHADAGRWDDAAERAREAAPYLHPRLSAVAVAGRIDHNNQPLVPVINVTIGGQPLAQIENNERKSNDGTRG